MKDDTQLSATIATLRLNEGLPSALYMDTILALFTISRSGDSGDSIFERRSARLSGNCVPRVLAGAPGACRCPGCLPVPRALAGALGACRCPGRLPVPRALAGDILHCAWSTLS